VTELVNELRFARPRAPEALRERVAELAARAPEPARAPAPRPAFSWPRLPVRRLVLVGAPAVIALGLGYAAVHGIATSGSSADEATSAQTVEAAAREVPRRNPELNADADAALRSAGVGQRTVGQPQVLRGRDAPAAAPLPPSARLQNYSASMRIRLEDVDGLSGATVRAMRIARNLGGYIVSVQYGSGRREGEAYLTVRVPVQRVQRALMRYSGLGTIVAQNVRIQDLQEGVDRLERRMDRIRNEIARIDAQLKNPNLTVGERQELEAKREGWVEQLRTLGRQRGATVRRAQFATFSINLTTAEPKKEEAPPAGRFRRMLDDAGSVLVQEVAWTLFVLAVAAPFLVLLGLGFWGARAARRMSDRRLLESS
jgi:hypothetical protein